MLRSVPNLGLHPFHRRNDRSHSFLNIQSPVDFEL